MGKEKFLKARLSEKVHMTPTGFVADQLTPSQFTAMADLFFDQAVEISRADVSDTAGYGQLDDDGHAPYLTCKEYLVHTFDDDKPGYWYHWRELFETTPSLLDRGFFEAYFQEMTARIPFCENRRYLVNNNTFFEYMLTDGQTRVGFLDWSRAGICDFLIDLAIMDLNKPYMKIPELFADYCRRIGLEIPDYKERFLCMAYFKGLDGLRWHASIDDEESCLSIMKSISELKTRLDAI